MAAAAAGSCESDGGAMESSSTDVAAEALLQTLISRGWHFRDAGGMRALIRSTASSGGGDRDASRLLGAVEAELLNMDLRSFGGKSLPDPSATKKLSQLQDSQCHRRLLRFSLTDGQTEVIAIEYAPIPSISEGVISGTKVLLENKIAVHNGILCLNSKVITILGGLVQSLFDEWQMSQKYSGFSRSTFKLSQNNEGVGPPPFEKLQLEARCSQPHNLRGKRTRTWTICSLLAPTLRDSQSIAKDFLPQNSNVREAKKHNAPVLEAKTQFSDSKVETDQKMGSATGSEDQSNSSEPRPREVIEALPVQNQAAAQKLLQKMNQSVHDNRHHRGPKYRGKGKQEETAVFTLDEWERRKASAINMTGTSEIHDVSRDEELAWQLQNQLDMEDGYINAEHFQMERFQDTDAEQIKMSMFNYGRTGEMNDGRNESGRRGRGRGRWRGRGRGRFTLFIIIDRSG
ncbi:hypothetical protein Taro_022086 [Colocasia esculenta]|uniref:RecQ mediated genome instability protein 1 OB-fold domain-containing protein n=1 Tax=Colocasia esculenta TaxID=4460 RepID=A0A843V0P1_COLES|nr:hypothetical protein [Colocasia esculenta]